MATVLVENWDGSVSIVGTNNRPFVDPGKKPVNPLDIVVNRSYDKIYSTPPNNVNKSYSPGSIQVKGKVPTTSGIGTNTGITSTSGVSLRNTGNLVNGIAGILSDQLIKSNPAQKAIQDASLWTADQIRGILGKPPLTQLERALARDRANYEKYKKDYWTDGGRGYPTPPQVDPVNPPAPKPLQNPGNPSSPSTPDAYNPNNPATPNRPDNAPVPIPPPLPITPIDPNKPNTNIPDGLMPTNPQSPGYPTVPPDGFDYDFPNPIGSPTQFFVRAKFLRQDLRNRPNGMWSIRENFGNPYPFELNSGNYFGIPVGITLQRWNVRQLDMDNDPSVTVNRTIYDVAVLLRYKTSSVSEVFSVLAAIDYSQSMTLTLSAIAEIVFNGSGLPNDQIANPNQPVPTPPPPLPIDYAPPQFIGSPDLVRNLNNLLGSPVGTPLGNPPKIQPVAPLLPIALPLPSGTPSPQSQPSPTPTPQPNNQPIPRDNPNNAGQPQTEIKLNPVDKPIPQTIDPTSTPNGNVQFNPTKLLPTNGFSPINPQKVSYTPTTGFQSTPTPATGFKGSPEMNPTNATGQLSSGAQQNLQNKQNPVEVPNQVTAPVCNDPCIADLQRNNYNNNQMVEITVNKFSFWNRLTGARYVPERVRVPQNMVPFATTVLNRQADIRSRFGRHELIQRLQNFMNTLSTIATLHNAAMLSTSAAQSLGNLVTEGFQTFAPFFGIPDETAQSFDLNEVLGKQVNEFLESVLGKETWEGTKEGWLKLNRIVTTASNVVWSIRSIMDSTAMIMEWTAENTGKIGNALKKFRVVGENAYGWMPERMTAQNRWSKFVERFTEGVEGIENTASSLSSVVSEVRSIRDEVGELKTNRENFEQAIKQATPKAREENTAVKDKVTQDRNASKSPDIAVSDREEGTTEE